MGAISASEEHVAAKSGLRTLALYSLRLGALGFAGPIALVGCYAAGLGGRKEVDFPRRLLRRPRCDHYAEGEQIPTVKGACTSFFSADLDRSFLAVRRQGSRPTVSRVNRCEKDDVALVRQHSGLNGRN